MINSFIALKLSDRNIEMAYIKSINKVYKIVNCDIVSIESETIDDGMILDSDRVIEPIVKFIKFNNINCKNIVISIQSTYTMIRNIESPNLKSNKLHKFIQYQLQDIFPADMSEYIYDYRISNISDNNKYITVTAVPNTIINKYIEISKLLNLNILDIDISSNNIAELVKYMDSDTFVVFNIEDCSTDIIIIENKKILFLKTIHFGKYDLDSLIYELQRIIEFCSIKYENLSISKIYISGKYDMCKYIQSTFNIATFNLNKSEIIQHIHASDYMMDFTCIVGIVNKTDILNDFNLVPKSYIQSLNHRKNQFISILKISIYIVATLNAFIAPNIYISFKEKQLKEIDSKIDISKFDKIHRIEVQLKNLKSEIEFKNNIISNLSSGSDLISNILNILAGNSTTQIYSLDIDSINSHLSLTGVTDSIENILNYILDLESYSYFKNISFKIDSENKAKDSIIYSLEMDLTI